MSAADCAAERASAFRIVVDLESSLLSAQRFARAIVLIALSLEAEGHDERDTGALIGIADAIRDYCGEIEERRGDLFRLLHPCREEFEREGWPSDKPQAALQ
jgi:hypothetical protein